MFFLLSGLILQSGTFLRWFYLHTAAENWLSKVPLFFTVVDICVFPGKWLNVDALLGCARVQVCMSGKGRGRLWRCRDARPRKSCAWW